MTETDLMRTISVELCRRGCIVHRTNSGTYYTKDGRPVRIGVPGMSDLQGHRPDGRCFYLEVKKPGKKPRENQISFIRAMRSTGAIAGWADSVERALEVVENGDSI